LDSILFYFIEFYFTSIHFISFQFIVEMGSESSTTTGGNDDGYKTKYDEQYPGQLPNGRDAYGNVTYDRYTPSYAGELPTGRDSYGNVTYGDAPDG
jgi:hypothetical protein